MWCSAAEMVPLVWPELSSIHPFAPLNQANGYQKMFADMEKYLCEITGVLILTFLLN